MGINQPTLLAPRQEQREEKTEKKSWQERLIEGLKIAQGITGIVADVGQIKHNSLRNKDLEDQRQGILTNDQFLNATGEDFEVVPVGTEGAMPFKRRGDGGALLDTPLRRVAKPQKTALQQITIPDPKTGKPMTTFVREEEGAQYNAYQAPRETKPDALSKVDYGKAAQSAGDKFRDDAAKPLMAIDAAGEAENLVKLAETNPAAAAAAVRKLARASGDSGVMSDSDVQAFGGSQAMTDTFARIFERAKSGTMTPDDVKYATEVAQVLKSNAESAYGSLATDAATRFKANFGGDDDDIYLRITGKQRQKAKATPAAPGQKQGAGEAFAAPSDAPTGPSREEIEAELQRRGVKPRGATGGF